MNVSLRIGLIAILALALAGCGSKKDTPVKDSGERPPAVSTPNTGGPTQPGPDKAITPPGKDDPGNKAVYPRDEIKRLLVGRPKDEVLKRLGEPNTTGQDGDDEYWYYNERTQNADGTVDERAMVSMRKGVVQGVRFFGRAE